MFPRPRFAPLTAAAAAVILLSGCASNSGVAGRLAPRAAEAIDPRVPIPAEEVAGRASAALSAELARLVRIAVAATGPFESAAATARAAASAAGPAQSESWIEAQEKLSAAIAARAPVGRSLADIDATGALALAERGGLTVGDRLAIEAAAHEVGAIDQRQAASLAAIAAMLVR